MKTTNIVLIALVGVVLMSGFGGESVEQINDKTQPHKTQRVYMDDFRKNISFEYHISSLRDDLYFLLLDGVKNGKPVQLYKDIHTQFYIDVDNSGATGYNNESQYDTGSEYLIEDGVLFKYIGTGGRDWNWEIISYNIGVTPFGRMLDRGLIPELGDVFSTEAAILDENWETVDYTVNKKYISKINKIDTFNLQDTEKVAVSLLKYENALHFEAKITDDNIKHVQYYLDTDKNDQTGYTTGFIDGGFEYLLEDDRVYK